MRKTNSLGIRLLPDTKLALERAAAKNNRSISNLVDKVLSDYLRASGELPQADPEPPRKASRRRREMAKQWEAREMA